MIRCPRCSHEWNPARQALTKRQLDVFRWIEAYFRREGVAPRQSEIAKGLGFTSRSTVHEHLENLLEAHTMAEQRSFNAADPGSRSTGRGGPPTPIAMISTSSVTEDKRRETEGAYDVARQQACRAWAKAHELEYRAIVASATEKWREFLDKAFGERARDSDVVKAVAERVGFPDFDTWLASREQPPPPPGPEAPPNPGITLPADRPASPSSSAEP